LQGVTSVPHPALVPAIALLAGVALASAFPVPPVASLLLASAALVTAAGVYRIGAVHAVVIVTGVGFAAAGAALGAAADRAARLTPLRALFDQGRGAGEPVAIEMRLVEDGAPTPYGASLRGDALTVDGRPTRGGLRLVVSGGLVATRLDEWRAGRLVRVTATLRRPTRYLNPGARDEEVALARRGVSLVGSIKSAALVQVTGYGSFIDEAAAACRRYVRLGVTAAIGVSAPEASAIVTAILIGDRAGLDPAVEDRLQRAGTYHVIAISGGNIAILAGLMVWFAIRVGTAWRPAAAIVVIGLVAYAQVVSGGASVSRAVLVACAAFGARLIDHRVSPLNAVAVAGVVVVCTTPLVLHDAGFALSFGATIGILLGVPALCDVQAGSILRAPIALFAATVCAELATMPIAAWNFSRVTVAGLLLNFCAIPLMTVAQVAGIVMVGASAVSETLASYAGGVATVAIEGLVGSTRLLEWVPGLSWRVPAPPAWLLVAYYAALIVVVRMRRRFVVRHVASGVVAISLGGILAGPLPLPRSGTRGNASAALRVTHLDVGQGDATLVQFPGGDTLLVDTGGTLGGFDIGSRVVAPALWALGVRRLTALALTHGDPDHIGGAVAVLRDFRPREVWEGIPVPPHAPMQVIRGEADRIRATWRRLQTGDAIMFGDVQLFVRHPPPPDWERQRVRNDDSLVLEMRRGSVSIVLPGDISAEIERVITAQLPTAPLHIVKAPHHGSATSSSGPFIDALRPQLTVISAGRANRYGHPAATVVRRYVAAGVQIFRTDVDGAVTIETDGARADVRGFTGRSLRLPVSSADFSR
jgi:competence protein ComEC